MQHRRSAVVALCVVVALVAAACAGQASALTTDTPVSGSQSVATGTPTPGSSAPAPSTNTDDPPWNPAPQWALHPETLRGSKQFQTLTHKGNPTPGKRPNIVLISTDDQNADEMRWMPKTRALLGGPGTSFSHMLSPHPLCCPARAMLLTGQYAQNNGVRSNFWPSGGYYRLDNTNTLPVWLKRAGYQTAFTGKYMNEYGLLDPKEVPPGWDHWRAPVGAGVYDYYNFTANEDGQLKDMSGTYQSDYYADETEDLVAQMSDEDKPFFLWQSNLAPHTACPTPPSGSDKACWDEPTPSMRYENMFNHAQPPSRRSPAFNERDVTDKPGFIASRHPLGPIDRHHIANLFRSRIESLQSVDDTVARTVAALHEAGELDDTLIIFTSDNGYVMGQHRYQGKILGYEPALRVPLLMRGPSVPAGARRSATVGMTDITPTILAAAGAKPGLPVDGRNLLPVANGKAPGWDTVLIQGGPRLHGTGDKWLYRGVRTDRYSYMEWRRTGELELYDRQRDPYELRNVAKDPAYADTVDELHRRLLRLQDCAGASCRQRFGPVPGPRPLS